LFIHPHQRLCRETNKATLIRETTTHLRLAAAHVTGVQAGVADGMLVAQPGEEALQTETVATVGRRTVSVKDMLVHVCFLIDDGEWDSTYFLTSVYQ
jgi:hypothetical protein